MISPIVGDIAQWVAVVIIGGGLWASWRRNGQHAAEGQGIMSEKISNLEKVAESNVNKSDEILLSLNEMKEHCARVSTGLTTRVNGLENIRRK